MAEKIYKIQKELEEKRAKRKREGPNQPTPPLPNTPGQPTGTRAVNPTGPRLPGQPPQRMPVSLPNQISNPGQFPMDTNSLQQTTAGPVTSIPGPPGSTEPSVLRSQLMAPASSVGQNGPIRTNINSLGQTVSMPGVVNNPNMSADQQNSMLMQQLALAPVSDPKASDINRVSFYYTTFASLTKIESSQLRAFLT